MPWTYLQQTDVQQPSVLLLKSVSSCQNLHVILKSTARSFLVDNNPIIQSRFYLKQYFRIELICPCWSIILIILQPSTTTTRPSQPSSNLLSVRLFVAAGKILVEFMCASAAAAALVVLSKYSQAVLYVSRLLQRTTRLILACIKVLTPTDEIHSRWWWAKSTWSKIKNWRSNIKDRVNSKVRFWVSFGRANERLYFSRNTSK